MKISIVMPGSAGQRSGNRHTAQRWAAFLRESGHRVSIADEWTGTATDMLIALHARKSHSSVQRFHELHPDAPLTVALTGTDLYRDIASSEEAKRSLDMATRLIVLQELGPRELPVRHRAKTRIVYQSSDVALTHVPHGKRFRVTVIGHLREEKDPFRAAMALGHMPRLNVEVVQLGAALAPEMADEARRWMECEPRYRWLQSKPHAQAMRWLAGSHLMVISSVMEGGANVICEAARIGVPVVASRVSGNIGMLGPGYPGYFRLFDDKALAQLMAKAASDGRFYASLKGAIRERRRLFAPAAEKRALLRALQ